MAGPRAETRDKYLYGEIQKVGTHVNEIARAVNALPAEVDARIEPLNGRLATLAQAIESLSKLSENVEKIREEFAGFGTFRERIEGREKSIEDAMKKLATRAVVGVIGLIVSVAGAAYYVGSTMTGIDANIAQTKDSVGEMKTSLDKLQAATYELNGTLKGQGERLNAQGERLKGVEEQLKAAQASIREAPAKTAAEASDKTSERVAGVIEALGKRINQTNAELAGKLEAIGHRVDEASDVLVVWLTLSPGDKPVGRSDTTLTYYLPVPPPQRQKVIQALQSKTLLGGVVNLFDGEALLRPPGVTATAQPMKEDGRIPIQFFFQDRSALEGFERLQNPSPEAHKSIRLRITFTLG